MKDYPKVGDKVVVRFQGTEDEAVNRLGICRFEYDYFNEKECDIIQVDGTEYHPVISVRNKEGNWLCVEICDIEHADKHFTIKEEKRYNIIGDRFRADNFGDTLVKISANAPDSAAAADRLFVGSADDIDELIALLTKVKELTYGT